MGSRSFRSQWFSAACYGGLAVFTYFVNGGSVMAGLVVPLIFLVMAVASSPLLKRKSVSHETAVQSGHGVVVYHRPGCTFCIRMKAMLGSAGKQATWVDIWDDDEAAEYVRSVNDGNETVPTVVIDGQPMTNPAPSIVRDALTASAA